jgi:hypothetical protein
VWTYIKSDRIVRDESIATEDWEATTGIVTKDLLEKSVTFFYDAPKTWPPTYSATFSFSTTASRTETIDLDWDYSWFHSYFLAYTRVVLYVEREGLPLTEVELVNIAGGDYRQATGSITINLEEGDLYGISIFGGHYDSAETISGTIKLTQN